MDEATWSVCADPFAMLNFLQTRGWGSDRKMRLVCCALCRAVEHLLTDERYRRALDVAERYAEGLAGVSELRQAHGVVVRVTTHTEDYEWSEDKQGMLLAANALEWATVLREPPDPPGYLAGCAALGAKNASVSEGVPEAEVHGSQSALLRDILGPLPFRPVAVPPSVLAWDNGTVVTLARAIYLERRFGDLPILADALEEAGCDDPEILAHCRLSGPHVRGCWVVDLLVGK
jgi:hypothetical protein